MESKKCSLSDDPFAKVRELLKNRKNNELLHALIDEKNGRLRKKFQKNKNHAWYYAGCAYFEMEDLESAKKAFIKAYKYNSTDMQSLIACGICLSEMKKPKYAERIFRKALMQNPEKEEKATIIYNLGNSLFDQGLYKDAIETYTHVIKRRDKIGVAARKNSILSRQLLRASDYYPME